MSSSFNFAQATQPESMQLSDCVKPVASLGESAIDEFEGALTALVITSQALDSAAHPQILAEMLIVSAVGSVESYFRRLLGSLLAVCPITLENVKSETIKVGAAIVYPKELLGFALLERTLFSSTGVIARELKKFLKFDIKGHPEIPAAVAAFERVCIVRHSAAHWRGFLDSENALMLGIDTGGEEVLRLDASQTLVERSFAACDHLVHVCNDALAKLVSSRWLEANIISLADTSEADAVQKCGELVRVFGSSSFLSELPNPGKTMYDQLCSEVESSDDPL